MKKETLLQRAKKIETRKRREKQDYTLEDLELAIAWIKCEVVGIQMCKRLIFKVLKSSSSGNYLYYVASVLKKFYREGKVKIELKK